MTKITLPLPDRKLSPNARIHWAQKAKLVKQHRTLSHTICAMNNIGWNKPVRFKSYTLHFFWPDKRRHDRDNASATCKAYLDGISDAIGQDDSQWGFNGVRFEVDKENPRIEIRFEMEEE